MPPLTNTQARVTDPVLTQVARGYVNGMAAYPHLFPVVTVETRGGKVVAFGAEDFLEIDTERAPGETRAEVEVKHGADDYALTQNALDGVVPMETDEEAASVGIDQEMETVRKVKGILDLRIEINAAKLATTPATYPATNRVTIANGSQNRWDNENSHPADQVEKAKEQIAQGVGRDPNVLVLGPKTYRSLVNHVDVIDRVKYNERLGANGKPSVTPEKLSAYFDVERVVVARCRKGEPGAFVPVWGPHAVLAYSNVSPLRSRGTPSFGYTYRLRGYPRAGRGYYNQKRESFIYPVTTEDSPVVAGAAAGYLFQNAVTP